MRLVSTPLGSNTRGRNGLIGPARKRVRAVRRLDLHDVGAELGQRGGGDVAGDRGTEGQDAQAGDPWAARERPRVLRCASMRHRAARRRCSPSSGASRRYDSNGVEDLNGIPGVRNRPVPARSCSCQKSREASWSFVGELQRGVDGGARDLVVLREVPQLRHRVGREQRGHMGASSRPAPSARRGRQLGVAQVRGVADHLEEAQPVRRVEGEDLDLAVGDVPDPAGRGVPVLAGLGTLRTAPYSATATSCPGTRACRGAPARPPARRRRAARAGRPWPRSGVRGQLVVHGLGGDRPRRALRRSEGPHLAGVRERRQVRRPEAGVRTVDAVRRQDDHDGVRVRPGKRPPWAVPPGDGTSHGRRDHDDVAPVGQRAQDVDRGRVVEVDLHAALVGVVVREGQARPPARTRRGRAAAAAAARRRPWARP